MTTRRAPTWVGACLALAAGALMPVVRADVVVTRQSGVIIAAGQSGTVQDVAPESTPWSSVALSTGGSPGTFTGLATVNTTWSPTHIVIESRGEISPGAGPPVVTQGMVQLDIEFDLTAPARVEVRFDVVDNISAPPPPFVFTTTRVVDMTTVVELQTEPGVYHFSLPAGPYRLQVQNMLGNMEDDLVFSASARSITGEFTILPPCDIDFNNDGLVPDVQDIEDLLLVFAGATCPTGADQCDSVDFNADGLFPDVQDIEDFLDAFAGGAC